MRFPLIPVAVFTYYFELNNAKTFFDWFVRYFADLLIIPKVTL